MQSNKEKRKRKGKSKIQHESEHRMQAWCLVKLISNRRQSKDSGGEEELKANDAEARSASKNTRSCSGGVKKI